MLRVLAWLPAIGLIVGCSHLDIPTNRSPLRPLGMSPEACVLDLYFVRCAVDDPRANTALWSEVDEQRLPPEIRKALACNGFRAGLVGHQVPPVLAELMDLADKPLADDAALDAQMTPIDETPKRVVCRRLHSRSGRRQEIMVSGIYDELPVLLCEDEQVSGHTYEKAQAVFALKTWNERDGGVRVELTPELHYGDPTQRWIGMEGVLRLETGRPRRVLEHLALGATLSPGQILVLGRMPNRSGSLGYQFFSEKLAGPVEQKLLLLRLAQTQHDDLLKDGP